MKICAIICEFNPFHNGHKYLLEQARDLCGCDKILCLMSGSFTQRGEICIQSRSVRARHAVLGGADAVLELPVAFSVAPAEVFAKGAIKLLSSIPDVCTLAFGCENDDKQEFLRAAELLNNESPEFKAELEKGLKNGDSHIVSYRNAFVKSGGNASLTDKPNNVLGLEYTKAILRSKSNIDILPIKRTGADFSDGALRENFSSAKAIRQNLNSELIKNNVPDFVLNDKLYDSQTEFGDCMRLVLTRTEAEKLCDIYGCGEGLENRLKSLELLTFDEIIESATTKRYSSSRIRRILSANFLNLKKSSCEKFLSAPLYLKPIAVKKDCADELLAALSKSPFPVLTTGSGKLLLENTALECLECDEFAYNQWLAVTHFNKRENGLILV